MSTYLVEIQQFQGFDMTKSTERNSNTKTIPAYFIFSISCYTNLCISNWIETLNLRV